MFYSFHYADVNRVNQVRKSGQIRPKDRERRKTVQDRSLWENVRSTNERYLKDSINRNIFGTSATCVLTGRDTWARPWVRYEIARSLLNGNGIFAVRIHGGISLDNQKDRLGEHYRRLGIELVDIYRDGGLSGTTVHGPACRRCSNMPCGPVPASPRSAATAFRGFSVTIIYSSITAGS
ncbi:TIR domain-containing protein [uncultured Sphingomonas sp.]|uniref:TIR domain-containing protein n=1 Tax=uncultured Sphingomonas sp. TaxID=158754 RepID=UPI0035CA6AC8